MIIGEKLIIGSANKFLCANELLMVFLSNLTQFGKIQISQTKDYHYLRGLYFLPDCLDESAGLGQQNTPTASLQRGKTPSMSVLCMTLSNLMVRI